MFGSAARMTKLKQKLKANEEFSRETKESKKAENDQRYEKGREGKGWCEAQEIKGVWKNLDGRTKEAE